MTEMKKCFGGVPKPKPPQLDVNQEIQKLYAIQDPTEMFEKLKDFILRLGQVYTKKQIMALYTQNQKVVQDLFSKLKKEDRPKIDAVINSLE